MIDKEENKITWNDVNWNNKITLVMRVLWAMLVLFSAVGAANNSIKGIVALVICCVCWITLAIVMDGITACAFLFELWRTKNKHD